MCECVCVCVCVYVRLYTRIYTRDAVVLTRPSASFPHQSSPRAQHQQLASCQRRSTLRKFSQDRCSECMATYCTYTASEVSLSRGLEIELLLAVLSLQTSLYQKLASICD